MKLNKTLAIALHRAMWTDMQTELGDNPSPAQRANFKDEWIKEYFPNECVMHNCFLCEYAFRNTNICSCVACPISWPAGHCSGNPDNNFSYCTAPISDILALPAKNEKLTGLKAKYIADETEAVRAYYTYREELLSKASGLPGSVCIEDHVKAIKEKAVDEYFKNTPGAKLATMDVDEAFKQYADEQMEPLKQMNDRLTKRHIEVKECLAKESGLDRDRPVADHIREIVRNSMEAGAAEERDRIQEKIYEVLLS